MYYTKMDSPVGELLLIADGKALVEIDFAERRETLDEDWRESAEHPVLKKTRTQLVEYFAGTRKRFDVPLAPEGTAFQRSVWKALEAIPWGETQSYGTIARKIGKPRAVRAVGSACATNPLPVIVPCHRVLRSDGGLGGYLGGTAAKTTLLELEHAS